MPRAAKKRTPPRRAPTGRARKTADRRRCDAKVTNPLSPAELRRLTRSSGVAARTHAVYSRDCRGFGMAKVAGMRQVSRSTSLCAALLFCASLAAPAHAQIVEQDLGVLAAVESGVSVAVEPALRTRIVGVEIDGVDMSGVAQISDTGLVVTPATPLAPGAHRMVLFGSEGDAIEPIAVFVFTTEGGAARADAGEDAGGDAGEDAGEDAADDAPSRFGAELIGTAQANRRIDQDGSGQQDASYTGDLTATFEEDRLAANVKWLATARKQDRLDPDNPATISEYQIASRESLGRATIASVLGDQTLTYDQALLSSVNRRGFSIDLSEQSGRIGVGAFALRTAESIGADNPSGLDERDDRLFGGQVRVAPLAGVDLSFTVSGYGGRGAIDPSPASTVGLGSGLSLGGNGSFFGGKTTVEATFAGTLWDEDARGGTFKREDATGVAAGVTQRLWSGAEGQTLSAGARYERVEQPFETLGATTFNPGIETFAGTLDYTGTSFSLGLKADRQKTNIGSSIELETDQIWTAGASVTWSPFQNEDRAAWLRGTSFDVSYQFTDTDRLTTPSEAVDPADATTHGLGAGVSIFAGGVSLSQRVDALWSDSDFEGGVDATAVTLSTSLSGWTPVEWMEFGVTTSVTYNENDEEAVFFDGDVKTTLKLRLRPDLTLSLDGGYQTAGAAFGEDGRVATAALEWRAFDFAALTLSGGYADGVLAESGQDDGEADLEPDRESYFVGFTLRVDTNLPQ